MQLCSEVDRIIQTGPLLPLPMLPLPRTAHLSFPPTCPLQLDLPTFKPHALLRGGNRQTLVGNLLAGTVSTYTAEQHVIPVSHGDAIVLHDDCPDDWQPGDRSVLLVHGLAGCHESGYMARTADKLNAAGVRSFRMDMRAAGAGADLAQLPYHCGCTEDVLQACRAIERLCPDSPLTVVGFSLGGNIILKMLGEHADDLPATIALAIGINPAIDLTVCHENLSRRRNHIYNRFFVRMIWEQVRARPKLKLPPGMLPESFLPGNVKEIDDCFTRTVWGFDSLEEYHTIGSALPWLSEIRVPTIALASADDPMIPVQLFRNLPNTSNLRVHIAPSGGHLGFIGKGGVDADRRWMEWRIVDWVLATSARRHVLRRAA